MGHVSAHQDEPRPYVPPRTRATTRRATVTPPVEPSPAPEPAPARKSKTEFLNVPTVIGELLLTVGIVLFLFVGYEAYWTNIKSGQMQAERETALDEQWAQPVNPRSQVDVPLGDAFARMFIPSFGNDYRYAILSGTTDAVLEAGPGHYVDTQMPGEAGNFAIAGHRVGKGAPFNDLGLLNTCDAIVIETASTWEIYRLLPTEDDTRDRATAAAECFDAAVVERVATGDYASVQGLFITTPDDIQAISPLPGTPNNGVAEGLLPTITLTTCHPQFSNAERMIVHGVHVRSQPKSEGEPVELSA